MRSFGNRLLVIISFFIFGNKVFSSTWIPIDNQSKGETISKDILESNETACKIKITIHGLYDQEIKGEYGTFHKLSIESDAYVSNIGEPTLPLITELIAIPKGASFKVSIIETEWTDIQIGTIYPYQKPLLEREKPTVFSMSEKAYKDIYIPPLVQIGDVEIWRNIRNFRIALCPFKYYPTKNSLSVLKEFVVQIYFDGTEKGCIASNDEWGLFSNIAFESSKIVDRNTTDDYDYLIIVSNSAIYNSQALKDFQKWKAFKGYKTKIVLTSTIGTTADQIKNYIAQEYNNYNINYVLFIGDDYQIPLKSVLTLAGRWVMSDYWYGCISSSGNQADIPVGRFSTTSLEEFTNMVDKTIKYEKSYSSSNQVLLVANKEGAPGNFQHCLETVRTTSYTEPMAFIKAYGASSVYGGNNATNAQVVNHINEGAHIINYRGHGDYNGWGDWNYANENFRSLEINNLDQETCALFFSIACQTGNIDTTCMLEVFTRAQNGGVGFIGATEESYNDPNNIYNKNLFKKLLNNGVYQMGNLNIAAHIQNMVSDPSFASDNAHCYICGCDPTLEIWTAVPQKITGAGIFSQNGIITLSTELNSYEVSLVSDNGELLNKISAVGHICSFTKPISNFYIVINKHNYYPYIIYFDSTSNYIQNKTFSTNFYYDKKPMIIGYDVTNSISYGNVVVKPDSYLGINNSNGDVIITKGFECQQGGTFVIK